jgi:hypothetical protein
LKKIKIQPIWWGAKVGGIFKSPNSKILLELNLEVNIPTNPKIQVPPQRDFHPNIYHLETLLLSSMVIYLLLSLKQDFKNL